MKITNEEASLLSMEHSNKPHWKDGCEHGCGCFLGTFSVLNHQHGKLAQEFYDLYVFEQQRSSAHEICIRYGDSVEEYISPGNLGEFLLRTDYKDEVSQRAARILLHFGIVKWVRRKQ